MDSHYDKKYNFRLEQETTMARTPGATNRTSREMKKDGQRDIERANHKAEKAALKKENAALKKQLKAK